MIELDALGRIYSAYDRSLRVTHAAGGMGNSQ
jgi:hypothetical protein